MTREAQTEQHGWYVDDKGRYIPVVKDYCLVGLNEVVPFPVTRTCKCDPACLFRAIFAPVVGIQCSCGVVWPVEAPTNQK